MFLKSNGEAIWSSGKGREGGIPGFETPVDLVLLGFAMRIHFPLVYLVILLPFAILFYHLFNAE